MADRRAELLEWANGRTDLSDLDRQVLVAKIVSASDESIRSDHACVGKHWFLISAVGDRHTCPYCGWHLTLREGPAA